MKNKTKALIGIALAVIIISVIVLTPAKQETIKIGVIAPLSGGPALWGQGSLNMIEMAVDEINAQGGINGKTVEIIAEDGKCKPTASASAAQKLIQVDGVKYILGGHCSPETATIAPIVQKNQVFMLAGTSTATGILNNFNYAFRTSPSNLVQAGLIADLAMNKYEINKVATITEQTAFAKSITNDFITAFEEKNGIIVIKQEFAPGQTDFRTELLKISEKDIDAIFISPQSPTSGAEIIKQIKEMGITSKVFGNTVVISKKVSVDAESLPENAFSVGPYVDIETGKAAILAEKYRERYESEIPYNTFFVGAAYDGVYMLKEALEHSEDPTQVKEYFANIENWEGSVATYSFDTNGDSSISNWRELRIEDNKEVFQEIV